MKECMILRGMKVVVIGAGCAGLCAAKNSIEAGLDVVVYEQTDQVGGTWVCREEVGKDKFGLDVHSSMYRGAVTNLPREIMGYPGFPMIEGNRSFISSEDVLKYYNRYADFFNLKTSIKFHHSVLRVSPKGKSQWLIVVKDLNYNRTATIIFDAVFICNGHNFCPLIPQYSGQEVFRGVQFHSHDYRHGDIFREQRVLVVGAGASAVDVVTDASKMADFVVQSHHWKKNQNIFATVSLVQKYPEISHLTENGVVFKDGTEDTFTMIVYCTGYRYSFPFLTPDCGVTYDQNYVTPLYQHCININRPTMAFIGLCQFVMASQVADMQARFALKFIT
uniref:Flavin-containing monooxygenase n=1 Tax=Lutzomyia longipalpis TaxID=7200 RepID=A0A1B0CED8_LUTLO